MKLISFSVGICSLVLISLSCGTSRKELPPYPTDKCENISLYQLPVITHGFSEYKFNNVTIQTFKKGSQFKEDHLEQYDVQLNDYSDLQRSTRSFTIPNEVTTASDIRILFSEDLIFELTELSADWEENWYIEAGYECSLVSYKLNGIIDSSGSNIIINAPDYKYK